MKDLCFQPIIRLSDSIDRGEADAEKLTDLFLDRAVSYTHLTLPTNREV